MPEKNPGYEGGGPIMCPGGMFIGDSVASKAAFTTYLIGKVKKENQKVKKGLNKGVFCMCLRLYNLSVCSMAETLTTTSPPVILQYKTPCFS